MSSTRSRFLQRAAVVVLAAVGAALPQIVIAQGDGLAGKWIFVPERSKFSGPPRVKEMTITYAEGGKSKTVEGVDGSGKAIKGTFDTTVDNKAHPVTGIPDYDTASFNKVGENAAVYTYDRRRTTVIVGTRTASKDGKTLTYSE